MERRTLLTTIGTGVVTAAAGCLSSANESDDTANDTDGDGGGPGPQPERTRVASGETDRRTFGDESLDGDGLRQSHVVALANRTDDAVEAIFSIRQDGEVAFEERFELGADGSIAVSLTELSRYELQASIPNVGSTTQALGLDLFGCNGGQTTIALQSDGTFETGTISTMMACPGVVTEHVAADESFEHLIGGGFGASDSNGAGGDGATSEERHSLGLDNPTDETWTIRAELSDTSGSLFDGVFTLEAGASVNLPIADSGDYEFATSVLETDATATEAVGTDLFDCNVSSTTAAVDVDGQLSVQTISTMMACDVDDD